MPNQKSHAPESKAKTSRSNTGSSLFDELAPDYDAWFEEAGKLIFAIEMQAFQGLLSSLPEPWLEVGVGSGRFRILAD